MASLLESVLPLVAAVLGLTAYAGHNGLPAPLVIQCTDLLDSNGTRVLAPQVDGFRGVETKLLQGGGRLYRVRYDTPNGAAPNMYPGFFVGSILDYVAQFPFFKRFGYEAKIERSTVWMRLPDERALNQVSAAVEKEMKEPGSGFRFQPAGKVATELELSRMYARKTIPLMSLDKWNEELAPYFYHDRTVHALTWIAVGPEIANAISSRHEALTALYDIVNRTGHADGFFGVDSALYFETEMLDEASAVTSLFSLERSLEKAIENAKEDSTLLTKVYSYNTEEAKLLSNLYLLTRSAKSLLDYKSDGEILLNTYNDWDRKQEVFDLAPFLSSEQKKAIHDLWLKTRNVPEASVDDLEPLRKRLWRRITFFGL
jgi:hypothetical protein